MREIIRGGFLLAIVLIAVGCGGGERQDPGTAPGGSALPATAVAGGAAGTVASGDAPSTVRYVADQGASITLTLTTSPDGSVKGTMVEGDESMPVTARRQGSGFEGTVGPENDTIPFTAKEQGDGLVFIVGGDEDAALTFRRSGSEGTDSVPSRTSSSTETGRRRVVINERRLSDDEIARAESAYRIRIPDADYWYDRTLGAWGAKGGPTMGFIAAGLDLGGPLRADASGGGTGVFVNGREIHPSDLAALQTITGPIVPGRYFIDAQGLAGDEGGAPQWNLAALAAQRGGGGGSRTWQSGITGASGFSDGTTGAVFLPNGGIVSTGN